MTISTPHGLMYTDQADAPSRKAERKAATTQRRANRDRRTAKASR